MIWPNEKTGFNSCPHYKLLGFGDGEEALAEGRRGKPAFDGAGDGEDDAVEHADGADFELTFLEDAEIQPPGEVAGDVEVLEAHDVETGVVQFLLQVGLHVTAEVAEVFIDGGVNLRARGDEEAEAAFALLEQARVTGELGGIVFDVFEDVDADDAVPMGIVVQRGNGAANDGDVRHIGFEHLAEIGVWLDGEDGFDGGEGGNFRGDLADAGADLDNVALEVRAKFDEEPFAVILRLLQCLELEIVRERKFIGTARHGLVEEIVLQDAAEGADTIFPTDLLAFGIGAAVVGDGHFVNAGIEFGDLRGDLGFEAEAVLLDLHLLDDLAAENFIARLHVREVQIREHVGHGGEHLVAQ